jgi:hypothetical protein
MRARTTIWRMLGPWDSVGKAHAAVAGWVALVRRLAGRDVPIDVGPRPAFSPNVALRAETSWQGRLMRAGAPARLALPSTTGPGPVPSNGTRTRTRTGRPVLPQGFRRKRPSARKRQTSL